VCRPDPPNEGKPRAVIARIFTNYGTAKLHRLALSRRQSISIAGYRGITRIRMDLWAVLRVGFLAAVLAIGFAQPYQQLLRSMRQKRTLAALAAVVVILIFD
jgi:hypothetical protein